MSVSWFTPQNNYNAGAGGGFMLLITNIVAPGVPDYFTLRVVRSVKMVRAGGTPINLVSCIEEFNGSLLFPTRNDNSRERNTIYFIGWGRCPDII